jgi:hypothetical protein
MQAGALSKERRDAMSQNDIRLKLIPIVAFALSTLSPLGYVQHASAQVLYGTVVGTISDPTGAFLSGAAVTITNDLTAQTRSTLTNAAGGFSFSDVVPGSYKLEASHSGFQKYIQTGIQASINTVTRVDVELPVGQLTQAVTVSTGGALLETDKADVHVDLASREVLDLPLPAYRNYQTLINLVPGATPGAFQNSINDTPMRDLSTNINGTNRNNNNTRVDGAIDKMNVINTHTLYVPPVESIDAVNISTNDFDAEQGMAGGAAITVITKSGTNQFHSSAFAFNANNALGARNFFFQGSKAPKSIDNIDGASLVARLERIAYSFLGTLKDCGRERTSRNFPQWPHRISEQGVFRNTAQSFTIP